MTSLKQIREDIKFLLRLVTVEKPTDVPKGLDPTFYITNTYDGDVAIAKQIQDIRERYGFDE